MIRLQTYRLPFRTPFRAAGQEWTHREGLLIEWNDGTNGWVSEAAPLPGRSPERLEEVIDVAREQRTRLFDWIQESHPLPEEIPPSLQFALSALRLQLRELRKSDEKPATGTTGTFTGTETLRMNGVIGLCSPEELESALQTHLRAGYTTLKIKLDSNPESRIRILHEQSNASPQLRFRIDANQSWHRDEASRWLDALDRLPVDYCEEPLLHPTLDELDELQQNSSLPIALDESVSELSELQEAARRSRLSTFVLKATVLGDLERIAATLGEFSRPIRSIWTTSLESAVARTTLRRAALEWGSTELAHGLDTGSLFEQDLVAPDRMPAAEQGPDRPASLNRYWAMPSRWLDRSHIQEIDEPLAF